MTVTREVEWDDYEREKMLARGEYLAGVHAEGCGFHESVATDKANLFQPEVRICSLCAQVDILHRVQAAEDEKAAGPDDKPDQPRPSDGRHIGIRMLPPTETTAKRTGRQ